MSAPAVRPDLTDDAFLGGALGVLQPRRGHRSGLDAVLLAARAPVRGGESVLDMGCGAGVAALCVLARVGDASAVLVDRDEAAVALARENAARNGLGARARVLAMTSRRAAALPPAGWSRAASTMSSPIRRSSRKARSARRPTPAGAPPMSRGPRARPRSSAGPLSPPVRCARAAA